MRQAAETRHLNVRNLSETALDDLTKGVKSQPYSQN